MSELTGVDVAREGVNQIQHRPVGESVSRSAGFSRSFKLNGFHTVSLASLISSAGETFSCARGRIEIDVTRPGEVRVIAYGNDPAALKIGNDNISVLIEYDSNTQLKSLRLIRGGITRSLTRSQLSLLLDESGFANKFPELHRAFRKQFALEDPSSSLSIREETAYQTLSLERIDQLLQTPQPLDDEINWLSSLRLSKAQEIRRMAVQCMEALAQRGVIPQERLTYERELFFKEDIREDLVYIERTIRNDRPFMDQLFRRVFNRSISFEELLGSEVSVRYFARGCNKQVYRTSLTLPTKERLTWAMTTIRDAQLGQGDFDAEAIASAMQAWEM